MTIAEKTGTILVAIDGSRNSMLAAGVGARMARLLNTRLGLVHVLEMPALGFWVGVDTRMKDDVRDQAEKQLTEISEKMAAVCDVVPEFYILEGLPDVKIAQVANDDPEVIMVVAGRHGIATEKHSHLKLRRASGRLTNKLAEQLRMPLLVVPPDVPLSHICPVMADMHPTGSPEA